MVSEKYVVQIIEVNEPRFQTNELYIWLLCKFILWYAFRDVY